jgi:WD40 repeat protein
MLATGSLDKKARLWEVASGREIVALRHENSVHSVAFSPDGRMLATGSWDNRARSWPVGLGLIDRVCACVHELPLSPRDRLRFGIESEQCTSKVSAALRVKFGLDKPDASASRGANR